MTYHMERTMPVPKSTPQADLDKETAIALGKIKRTFPYRLYEYLMSDPDSKILFWNKDGESFYADPELFERDVMHVYPGLVAIPTFKNFVRQLRVYEFDCHGETDLGYHHFSNPFFQRGKEELLTQIRSHVATNRSCRSKSSRKSVSDSTLTGRRNSWMDFLECPLENSPMPPYKNLRPRPQPPSVHMENNHAKKPKLTSVADASVQTDISMEMFSRLDPSHQSVTAMLFPSMAGFVQNLSLPPGQENIHPGLQATTPHYDVARGITSFRHSAFIDKGLNQCHGNYQGHLFAAEDSKEAFYGLANTPELHEVPLDAVWKQEDDASFIAL